MVTKGMGWLIADGECDDDRGRRSAESLFLARVVPDSVVGSGTGRSVEVEVEFESVPGVLFRDTSVV